MNYRPEIDGLRALAVSSVIFFHAGLSWVSGGYVGVDIFFVISGFLITSIIFTEIEAGRFSIGNFYERRMRRILPALFFVMLVCVPISWVILSPYDMKYFSKSLTYVSIFLSNTIFYKQSGYFDAAAELKPLLHTWSLGIEEQYYLFFPLLLIVILRYVKKYIVLALVIIFISSLVYAQYMVQLKPKAAFFLLQYRVWELMAGSIVAILVIKNRYRIDGYPFNNTLSFIGFFMLFFSIFFYDKSTPFPSFYTLVPVIGATLVIVFGIKGTKVAQILSLKPFVGIGLVSFSAYLWHQPIFAFYRHKSFLEPTLIEMLFLIAVVLILAVLTWRFVEKPFRNKEFLNRSQIFTLAFFCSVVFIAFGLYGYYSEGFLGRLNENEKRINDYRNHAGDWRTGSCFFGFDTKLPTFAAQCYADGKASESVLLWGDSHAASLYAGVSKQTSKITQLTSAGCPPILVDDYNGKKSDEICVATNLKISQFIREVRPGKILLHAVWDGYQDEQMLRGIDQTLKYIKKASPNSIVYLIGPVPQWKPTLPDFALRKHVTLDKETYLKMPLFSKLSKLETEIRSLCVQNNVQYISPLSKLCIKDECLVVAKTTTNFALTTFDSNHLTEEGSAILAEYIFNQI